MDSSTQYLRILSDQDTEVTKGSEESLKILYSKKFKYGKKLHDLVMGQNFFISLVGKKF